MRICGMLGELVTFIDFQVLNVWIKIFGGRLIYQPAVDSTGVFRHSIKHSRLRFAVRLPACYYSLFLWFNGFSSWLARKRILKSNWRSVSTTAGLFIYEFYVKIAGFGNIGGFYDAADLELESARDFVICVSSLLCHYPWRSALGDRRTDGHRFNIKPILTCSVRNVLDRPKNNGHEP